MTLFDRLHKLNTCCEDLVTLMHEVSKAHDICIVCGHRTEKEQNEAYKNKKSKLKWPNSKHNSLPSLAVDVAPVKGGTIDWNNLKAFRDLAVEIKKVANDLGIEVVWGGDWKTFIDLPHWEVPKK